MKQCGIKMKEIKKWMEENPSEYKAMYEKAEKKEYHAMKMVIKAIVAIRLQEDDDDISLADIKEYSKQQTQQGNDEEPNKIKSRQNENVNSASNTNIGASRPSESESSTQRENENGVGGREA